MTQPSTCTQTIQYPETNQPIADKLIEALNATFIDIVDNSWMHAGHANGGGSHLVITLVSGQFEGVGIIDRHRLVHGIIKDEMTNNIHALELKLHTPEQWQKQTL